MRRADRRRPARVGLTRATPRLHLVILVAFAAAVAAPLHAQRVAPPVAAPAPAELPRVTVSTTYPAGGRAVRVGASANLQAALDAARPGDVLLLPPGATWIVVRTDVPDASLGAAGTRMTPSRAAKLELARILSPNYEPAIGTEPAAHHWRFTGLEISV